MCLFLLLFLPIISTDCQESAQYLQSAVRDLRQMNYRQTLRRADTAMVAATAEPPKAVPAVDRRIHGDDAPPISLTKGELAALYEAAVAKGETLKLDTGDDSYIHAAVHELDDSDKSNDYHHPHQDHSPSSSDNNDQKGYYYYYYPIKSFLDEMSSQPSSSHEYSYKPHRTKDHDSHSPHYQYHSHHHQHNVTINKAMMDEKKPKSLEPLFMAISGFIGMAVMFVLSVLVLPKFGIKPPPKTKLFGKKGEKIEDFARLAMDAIDGGGCAERFACELSKTARAFNLQDNRFVRLLKRMAPGTFGRHIDRAGKYANKQLKCTAIPCKKKNNAPKKKNAQKKH